MLLSVVQRKEGRGQYFHKKTLCHQHLGILLHHLVALQLAASFCFSCDITGAQSTYLENQKSWRSATILCYFLTFNTKYSKQKRNKCGVCSYQQVQWSAPTCPRQHERVSFSEAKGTWPGSILMCSGESLAAQLCGAGARGQMQQRHLMKQPHLTILLFILIGRNLNQCTCQILLAPTVLQ